MRNRRAQERIAEAGTFRPRSALKSRMRPPTHGEGGEVTPKSFADLLAWYDPSDISTLYQDSAMTTPVTASGQTVGAIRDKSGNGRNMVQATASYKPTFTEAGGLRYLAYDGVDDVLETTTTIGGLMTACFAERKASDAAQSFLYFFNGGVLQMRSALAAANANYYARAGASGGANLNNLTGGVFASPDLAVMTQIARISAVSHKFRRNGVQLAIDTSTSQGAGVYGGPANLALGGVASGAGGGYNGRIYGAAFYTSDLSDTEALLLERYFAPKAGLTI